MRVNIEMQHSCTLVPRGIAQYGINLMKSLVRRNVYNYSISFFDYRRERNNRQYIDKYFNSDILRHITVFECNSLSYADVQLANLVNRPELYCHKSYSEYTGAEADVFHFPFSQTLFTNMSKPTVVTVHDVAPLLPKYSKYWGLAERLYFESGIKILEQAEDMLIVADSLCTKNDLISIAKISPKRVFVVHLAYDHTIHFPEPNEELLMDMGIDTPYLLYLAALDRRKGLLNIIDSFGQVKPRFKDLKLVLAGNHDGTFTDLFERIETSPFREDIICTGFVSDLQKRALLSGAEIFLFPSEYEGFGLPVLEAMACGSPVITTNVSSLPEVGGGAAVYVSPGNTQQLSYEIERLLSSSSLRKEYTQKGFEQIKKFSWDKTAQMTEDVYKIAFQREVI